MKLQKILLVFIILFAYFQICFGQKKQENLTLLDTVTKPSCEYLLNRLDFLYFETLKNSQSIGYVIIQGANPIQNKFYEFFVKNNSKFRNFDVSRLAVISSKSDDKLKIDFVISNDGKTKPDDAINDFPYFLPASNKAVIFAWETVEIVTIDREITFVGYDAPCKIETVNLSLLSMFLKSNPHLYADIKIYGKTRKRAKQLEKILLNRAINDSEISITRLKLSYGGIDKGITQLPGNISSIEIRLISVK